jgi:MIP family channel proteins
MKRELIKVCVAEFIGTFALIFVGIGAIANLGGDHAGLVGIALAHGLTIAVMASATGAISGGHLNPAVTFGLLVGGKICPSRALAYWVSQLLGAIVAAGIMMNVLGVKAVAGGTPDLALNVSVATGVIVEAVLTFFLVFVVYGSAVDGRAPKIGGLAIGLTVTLDILVGGPITGAAMNPARTFGPAFVSGHWANHIVYWVGPLLGGLLAGVIYGRFLIRSETPIETPTTIAATRPAAGSVSAK